MTIAVAIDLAGGQGILRAMSQLFQRILFGTDFSAQSQRAEAKAIELARALGSNVTALHVIEVIDPEGDQAPFEGFYAELRARAEQRFAAVSERFAHAGVPVEVRISVGSRWLEIVEAAGAEEFGLVVLGGGHVASEPRPVLGTTSQKVFLTCPVPLLLVR